MLTDEVLRVAAAEVQQFLVESVPEEEAAHKFSEDFEKKMKKTIRRERMRRWLPTLICLMVALVVFICCQFADPNILWQEPLSDADKEHLSEVIYAQVENPGVIGWYTTQASDNPYYGTINGCTIVRGEMHSIDCEWHGYGRVEVAGYVFYWEVPHELNVYRDGEACTLGEAYERSWLTKEQIGIIHEKHREYLSMRWDDGWDHIEQWWKTEGDKLQND